MMKTDGGLQMMSADTADRAVAAGAASRDEFLHVGEVVTIKGRDFKIKYMRPDGRVTVKLLPRK